MERMLRAEAHGVVALGSVGKLSPFLPSARAWPGRTRSRGAPTADHLVAPATRGLLTVPSFQPTGVGTLSEGCRIVRQRPRSSDFAEGCAWTR